MSGSKHKRIPDVSKQMPQSHLQIHREVMARIKFAQDRGGTRLQAIEWTARKMDMRVADVMTISNRNT